MAIRNIIKDDDPTLRKISRRVEEITPRIRTLLDDMLDTMHRANGCGLAAVQVGVLRRVVVVETEEGHPIELINPAIIKASEETQNELEGCLSLPGRWGYTVRPKTVTVRAQDRNGDFFEVTGSDLLARALCHELDHLDGKLYPDVSVHMLTKKEMKEAGLIPAD
ncbi:MAG: peptide deformylase [Clostridia bacterium]|nr:peptide deformylase [Clostridia bacterium]